MWTHTIGVPTNCAWNILYVFTITKLAMLRNFDVISAKFNVYQISRHRNIEDLNTEMNVFVLMEVIHRNG